MLLLVTGGIGLLLLLLSFVIRVRIVVVRPALGDVTTLVRTFWQVLVGIATLGSFGLGLYDVVRGIEIRERSVRRFEISGDANDVDVHVHVSDIAGLTGTISGDESQTNPDTENPSEAEASGLKSDHRERNDAQEDA